MRHRRWVLVFILFFAGMSPSSASGSDKKAVLQQVNRTYYNLKAQGLSEFSCEVIPDFEASWKGLKSDALGRDEVLPRAKRIHFQVAVGASGAASLSHQSNEAPPTEEVAERLRQVTGGTEQMVAGFFKTWSQLMINPPLPGGDNVYEMEELKDGYNFTADDGKVHVAVAVNRDLVISTEEVKMPDLEATLQLKFAPHEGGLVLDGYESTVKTGNAQPQQMSIKIEYQEIEGLALPQTVRIAMSLPQGQLDEPITFRNCQVKKK